MSPPLSAESPSALAIPRLLLVGASVRAAAESAARAGFSPYGVDLFGDADLVAQFPSHRVSNLADASIPLPPLDGFLYTGGLENHPAAVAAWAERASLWGNGPEALSRARDPVRWAAAMADLGPEIVPPEIRMEGAVPKKGRWLWKRRLSAGGLGVHSADSVFQSLGPEFYIFSTSGENVNVPHPPGWLLQRRYDGPTDAGIFFADAGGVTFLGATRQLSGRAWCTAAPFHYCGSIGPLPLSPREHAAWERLGEASARCAGLTGLFGIDAVRPPIPAGADLAFRPLVPVDLNPRYTASVEVLERAKGAAALALHRADCAAAWPCKPGLNPAEPRQVVGKAVVFAAAPLVVSPATASRWLELSRAGGRGDDAARADVPHPGTDVGAGEPIVTVFASGPTLEATLRNLRLEAAVALAEASGRPRRIP